VILLDPASDTHAVLEDELVTVYTAGASFLTDFTLQELQERLGPDRVERVHRRALLNLAAITQLVPLDAGGGRGEGGRRSGASAA
jgi:two-component system LytT family response regulator